MTVVRAVQIADLDQLWDLIGQATYGLTTLQISKEQLSERVEHSHFAFTRKTEKASGEPYVFVMEAPPSGRLVGLSCIFSKTGGYEPFYGYARVRESNYCELLKKVQEVEALHLQKIHDGPTEIGSLFLLPDFRGQGRGRLLSLARFIFMAAHPKRFADEVIAEMRGVMDDAGNCPFWEAIGRHFFGMDFPQADNLSTLNKRFIEDLMPRYPIYTSLLPAAARAVISDVHPQTRPALSLLEAEGFVKTNMVDIFDGGPVVRCRRTSIDAVRRTLKLAWQATDDLATDDLATDDLAAGALAAGALATAPAASSASKSDGPATTPCLVASTTQGFRATIANIEVGLQAARLPQPVADLLKLSSTEPVWVTALYPAPRSDEQPNDIHD